MVPSSGIEICSSDSSSSRKASNSSSDLFDLVDQQHRAVLAPHRLQERPRLEELLAEEGVVEHRAAGRSISWRPLAPARMSPSFSFSTWV